MESKFLGNSRFLGVSGSQEGAKLVGSSTPFHWKVDQDVVGFTFVDPNCGLALSLSSEITLSSVAYRSTIVYVLQDTAGNREAILNSRVALAAASSYKARAEQLDLESAANVIDTFKAFSKSVSEMEKHLTLISGRAELSRLIISQPTLFEATSTFSHTHPVPPAIKVFPPAIIPREPFSGHTAQVFSVSFSPDGLSVVSGSDDKTLRLWDAQTGNVLAIFSGHGGGILSTVVSPDGTRVVSGSDDKTLCIWDIRTGAEVSRFREHSGPVRSVAFSPDGKHVASGSHDGAVMVWDVATGLAVASLVTTIKSAVRSVAFSPDGTHIVSGRQDGKIEVWDIQERSLVLQRIQSTGYILSVMFSPDGTRVVTGSGDTTLCIWDIKSGVVTAGPLKGHTNWVRSVAYSPDGMHIVSGSDDRTIRIWDAQTGSVVAGPFTGHTAYVYSVAYSPDGTRIVSGSGDKTVRIWDAQPT